MNADRLLRLAEAAVAGGLTGVGFPSLPFTIQLKDDGELVVRLEEPLPREVGLAVWDEIHLCTGVHALVIDGDGCPWSRLLEAWP